MARRHIHVFIDEDPLAEEFNTEAKVVTVVDQVLNDRIPQYNPTVFATAEEADGMGEVIDT